MNQPENFAPALAAFMAEAQIKIDAAYPPVRKPVLSTEHGRKYIRIVCTDHPEINSGISVYCFVDSTNGDILKSAGWKGPAKHARGNIFDADHGRAAIGPYGANYL
jgi:hypothetical protein